MVQPLPQQSLVIGGIMIVELCLMSKKRGIDWGHVPVPQRRKEVTGVACGLRVRLFLLFVFSRLPPALLRLFLPTQTQTRTRSRPCAVFFVVVVVTLGIAHTRKRAHAAHGRPLPSLSKAHSGAAIVSLKR